MWSGLQPASQPALLWPKHFSAFSSPMLSEEAMLLRLLYHTLPLSFFSSFYGLPPAQRLDPTCPSLIPARRVPHSPVMLMGTHLSSISSLPGLTHLRGQIPPPQQGASPNRDCPGEPGIHTRVDEALEVAGPGERSRRRTEPASPEVRSLLDRGQEGG